MNWFDIAIYNVIFWTAWITISHIPYWAMQWVIDSYDQKPVKYLAGK